MNKAVFLDRDGILNEVTIINGKPYPPKDLIHTSLIYGIREVLVSLQKMGYLLIVISNQPDFENGLTTKKTIDEINKFVIDSLPLDDLYVCYHNQESNCDCRKPRIGNFLKAKEKYDIDMSKSWMIGDRKSDIDAGINAGCKNIFVDYNYNEDRPKNSNFIIYNIKDIVEIIYAN